MQDACNYSTAPECLYTPWAILKKVGASDKDEKDTLRPGEEPKRRLHPANCGVGLKNTQDRMQELRSQFWTTPTALTASPPILMRGAARSASS